jgi:glycerol transport system ATP-binding protein
VEGATAYIGSEAVALSRAYRALPQAERIELGIRPEFLRLQRRGTGLPVRVRRIDDIGRTRLARVEMSGRALTASVPEDMVVEGDEAALAFDPRQVHIYADGHLVPGEPAGDHAR